MGYTARQIAEHLDLSILGPMPSRFGIEMACELARENGIKSICVNPNKVVEAAKLFGNVCSVVGFPHGTSLPIVKLKEAQYAIEDGAKEIDVVINYGCLLDGDVFPVAIELNHMVKFAHENKVIVKAILETCYYTNQQISDTCDICVDCGVDFVKTSTGFAKSGASSEAARVMLLSVDGKCGVKASGGIGNYETVKQYLDMGCSRIGASSFTKLLPVCR